MEIREIRTGQVVRRTIGYTRLWDAGVPIRAVDDGLGYPLAMVRWVVGMAVGGLTIWR